MNTAIVDTAPATFTVVYDAGAGNDKAILVDNSGMMVRYIGRALAGLTTWSDLGLVGQSGPPILVQLPSETAQGLVFGEFATVYGVGDQMITETSAGYNATSSRYTDEMARVRFYAVLSRLLPTTQAVVKLGVGLNGNAYRKEGQRAALVQLYAGRHVFKADGRLFDVLVSPEVDVYAQPWGAARHFRRNPPVQLAERLQRQPLEQSNVLVIDGGRFTLDAAFLAPDPNRPGKLYPRDIFAFEECVDMMYRQLAAHIFKITGVYPSLELLERVFTSGKLSTDRTEIDLREVVAGIQWGVWISGFTKIQAQMTGRQVHYIFVVGGLVKVLGERITQTPIAGGRTLADMSGFAVDADPVWSVVLGYLPEFD